MRNLGTLPPSRRRGAAYIEFGLVFVLFITFIFAAFDFAFAVFTRGTLHHAVRAGVRFAITAQMEDGFGHDDSIRNIVKSNALGLIDTEEEFNHINIEYFRAACTGDCSSAFNNPGNIVVVSVQDFPVQPVASIMGLVDSYYINVAAVDKMEPFPGSPPPRTLPPPP